MKALFTRVSSYIALGALGVGIALFSMQRLEALEKAKQLEAPEPYRYAVATQPVTHNSLTEWVFAEGTALAGQREFLQFDASGKVIQLGKGINGKTIKVGSYVEQGTVLAKLDSRIASSDLVAAQSDVSRMQSERARIATDVSRMQAELRRAQSDKVRTLTERTRALSELKRMEAEKTRMQTDLQRQQVELKRVQNERQIEQQDFNRTQSLFKQRLIAKVEYDRALTKLRAAQSAVGTAQAGVRGSHAAIKSAQATIDGSRAALQGAEAAIAAADAVIASAQASLKGAEAGLKSADASIRSAKSQSKKRNVDLENATIVAPFSGVVTQMNIRMGDFVSGAGIARTDQERESSAAIILRNADQFEVQLNLPQWGNNQVAIGQRVYLAPADVSLGEKARQGFPKGSVTVGEVYAISPSISLQKRSIMLKVRTDEGSELLRDGMFVTAWIEVKRWENLLTIPWGAVLNREDGQFAFVFNSSSETVEEREIKTGVEGLASIEVLEGLKADEQLVVAGMHNLTQGALVRVVEPKQ